MARTLDLDENSLNYNNEDNWIRSRPVDLGKRILKKEDFSGGKRGIGLFS